jgi:dolichyl-phosphate mannosyltransferase polypeptide 3
MKRSTGYTLTLFVLVSAWLLSLTFLNHLVPAKYHDILWILPWYALVCFGSYTLFKIGIDLLTFNDYPEETKALEKDIKNAKHDLEVRGFKTD